MCRSILEARMIVKNDVLLDNLIYEFASKNTPHDELLLTGTNYSIGKVKGYLNHLASHFIDTGDPRVTILPEMDALVIKKVGERIRLPGIKGVHDHTSFFNKDGLFSTSNETTRHKFQDGEYGGRYYNNIRRGYINTIPSKPIHFVEYCGDLKNASFENSTGVFDSSIPDYFIVTFFDNNSIVKSILVQNVHKLVPPIFALYFNSLKLNTIHDYLNCNTTSLPNCNVIFSEISKRINDQNSKFVEYYYSYIQHGYSPFNINTSTTQAHFMNLDVAL